MKMILAAALLLFCSSLRTNPAQAASTRQYPPSLAMAEALLHAGRVSEARRLLRRIVAANPGDEKAAEAQCRLGWSYENAGDPTQAIAAYLVCRRLRGGDAADRARRRLEDLVDARDTATRRRASAGSQDTRTAAAALRDLGRPGLTAAARNATEKRLSVALAHACGALIGENPDANALLPQAVTAVRSPCLNEILRYLRLMTGDTMDAHALKHFSRLPALLAFARTAHSPALREAALFSAAEDGYLAGSPDRLLAAVTPVLPSAAVASDPAVVFLTQAAGRDGLTVEADVPITIEAGTESLRERLVGGAFDAGRLEDMVRFAAAVPPLPNTSDEDSRDLEMYRHYPDFSRAPLRLFARASARQNAAPADAVPLFLTVVRQYPASMLAVPSLFAAGTLLRQTHREAQANAVRAQIIHDYSNSPAALYLRAQDAADHNALDEADALLSRAEAQLGGADAPDQRQPVSQDMATLDLSSRISELQGAITQTRQVRESLRPAAVAAGRPALAEVSLADAFSSDRATLADRLADAMPSQAMVIYRALMPQPPYFDPVLSLHALARDPLGPESKPIWDALTSDAALGGGTFAGPAPANEAAATRLLQRTEGTPRAALALTLFEHMVSGSGGIPIGNWRPALASAQAVAASNAGTRVGVAALCVGARTLLENARPEDAAALLGDAGIALSAGDPVSAEASLLRQRAAEEVAAKQVPDWVPLWQTQVGPAGKEVITSYAPETPPGVSGGDLVVLWPGSASENDRAEEGWPGLAGLDPATGTRKWTTSLGSPVEDMAYASGRAFAFTLAGDLAALDAASGRILYRLPLAPGTQQEQPGWVAVTETGLIAVTGRGVWGLDPATGQTRWQRDWILSGIRGWPDKPPIIGSILYCMTTDGHLRAVDPATGTVQWERAAEAPDPDNGEITGGQPVPAGLHALLQRGDVIEAWDTDAGRPLTAARQVPGRVWMDGLLSDGRRMVLWDQNMPGSVSLLPGLTDTGITVPPKAEEEHGLLQGGVLYASTRDPVGGGTVFQAVDVSTGAVLGWWPLGGFSAGSWAGADGTRVYHASTDGSVRAFRLLKPLH